MEDLYHLCQNILVIFLDDLHNIDSDSTLKVVPKKYSGIFIHFWKLQKMFSWGLLSKWRLFEIKMSTRFSHRIDNILEWLVEFGFFVLMAYQLSLVI